MSYTLQQSANWISGFLQGQPTTSWGTNEPLMSTASMIQALIESPPFSWGWNRTENTSTTLNTTTQDYTVNITSFGFLERATVSTATGCWEIPKINNNTAMSVSVTTGTPAPNTVGRPQGITAQIINPGTSVKFRLSSIPDQAYQLNLTYQQAPALFTSMSQAWSVPDSMIQVYNNLLLGEMMAYSEDQRAQLYRQRGVMGLLAFADGLSQEGKALFMQSYLEQGAASITPTMVRQQAIQARAV